VKWLSRTTAALVIALAACLSLPIDAQDAPAKPTEKAKKKTLEDAIARAFRISARKVSDQKFLRATVLKGMHEDDETYLVICEYGTGDIAVFEGGVEAESDHWFLLEKPHVEALSEVAKRALERR
jgi:hypothetical protein